MPWHFWPALPEQDALRVSGPAPRDFLAYLARRGLRPPAFFIPPHPGDPSRRFTPFGWNAEARALNTRHVPPSEAPDAATVARVNSRAFSARLENALFPDHACPATFCGNIGELQKWLDAAAPGRYVAKGNQGLAGIGQLRFSLSGARAEADLMRARLGRLMARMGGLVLEREQKIIREFGVLFRVDRLGARSPLRVHRLLTRADGGYAGALRLPGEDPEFAPWREFAEDSADRVARALHREGYFGPVGLDQYVRRDGERARYRPLVDLNARCSMAWPAHGLAARFPERTILFSQHAASTLPVPRDYDEMAETFSTLPEFDSEQGRGFIWLTPLLSLPRHSLAFIGDGPADVLMQRDIFENLATRKTGR